MQSLLYPLHFYPSTTLHYPHFPHVHHTPSSNGKRKDIDDWQKCNLGKIPSNAIVTADFKTDQQKQIYWTLINYAQQFYASDGFIVSLCIGMCVCMVMCAWGSTWVCGLGYVHGCVHGSMYRCVYGYVCIDVSMGGCMGMYMGVSAFV